MKVNKEVKAALKQFADRLPATHKEFDPADKAASRPQTGAELLAAHPAIKGPKGEPIDPAKKYFIAGYGTATNHLKRLLKRYESGGMTAVVEYLRPYEAFLGTPDTEAPAPAADDCLHPGCSICERENSCGMKPLPVKKRKAKRITRPAAKV